MRTTTDPADFLHSPIHYVDSFALTSSTLAQFTPNNSVIFLGTHKISFTPEVAGELSSTFGDPPPSVVEISKRLPQLLFPELDMIEPFYHTPFHRERIPDELLKYWNVMNDGTINLPPSNMFIPDDFSIISKSSSDSNSPAKLNNDNNAVSMWWLLDTDDFHEPRVNLMCQLNNTNASTSAAWEGKIVTYCIAGVFVGEKFHGLKIISGR
jgi:secreted Zn-dependent insulinase-like peptidase